MKTLRLQLRFLLPLGLTLLLAAYGAQPLLEQASLRWIAHSLDTRDALLAHDLAEPVAEALRQGDLEPLRARMQRALQDERLLAIGVCGADGRTLQSVPALPAPLDCAGSLAAGARADARTEAAGGALHVGLQALPGAQPAAEAPPYLVLLHDLSGFERSSHALRWIWPGFLAGVGLLLALVTMAVAQWSWRGWVEGTRALLRGGALRGAAPPPELRPLLDELRSGLRGLEDSYRLRLREGLWDAARLRALLRSELRGDQVIVVSNREPYLHEQEGDAVVVRRPASGLVTAVEPVMRACSGTWIAHGSGSADRAACDAQDRVSVPPGQCDYWLRRIWLSEAEARGYYDGFANQGLWPLCLLAHVRPVFRAGDWDAYRAVNERFAEAVVAEARSADPVLLVQDYHFALLPALVRARLPQATILTFWHIPWPNPEAFGICPWGREILQGMLGSTILGFHTPVHCKNFLETVDRHLEARIEREHATVRYRGDKTLVQAYPISIAWPEAAQQQAWPPVAECRRRVVERLGLAPEGLCLAVGVDRLDYTKGILERLQALERALEQAPQWQGRLVLVQVAAPTRGALDEYRGYQARVEQAAQLLNQRFGRAGYQPVHLFTQYHDAQEVGVLFRAADLCIVSSLHDGMNLVCKEFIAARDDERGVLLLSRFAGAAGELPEALLVNPYHIEAMAEAILRAAQMPLAEQRERMASLRATVREANIYRWAARMLGDAARLRRRARIEARVRGHAARAPGGG